MTATPGGVSPATVATPGINFALLDKLCAEQGATDEVARADLLDVNRTTLWRWRNGIQTPGLDVAARIAGRLNITVDELIGRAT